MLSVSCSSAPLEPNAAAKPCPEGASVLSSWFSRRVGREGAHGSPPRHDGTACHNATIGAVGSTALFG